MPSLPVEILSTASIKGDGTGYSKDSVAYHWFGTHYAGNIFYNGWRCRVAESDLPEDPTDIDSFVLSIEANNTNANQSNGEFACIPDAPDWDGTNNPMAVYDETYGTITWNPSGWSAGVRKDTPDLSSIVGNAIDNATNDGGYRYFSIIWEPGAVTAVANVQIFGKGHVDTTNHPTISASYPTPVNWDATIDGNTEYEVSVDALLVDADIDCTGVSALGTSDGAGTYRKIDVYPPRNGTKPANGWPTLMYVHGGGWTAGSRKFEVYENGAWRPMFELLTNLGFIVVSVEYRLLNPEIFYNDIDYSLPQPVHDVRAAMEYYYNNGPTDYSADTNMVVIGGHSAGGHLSAFACLSAHSDDSNTYTGKQNANGDRPAGYGQTDTASPWQFDFNESGELSSSLKPVGLLLWDPPVNTYKMYSSIPEPQKTVAQGARKMLFGVIQGHSMPGSTYDEADIDHYIAGTGSTSYSSPLSASNIPPIFIITSTSEDVIPQDSSVDTLESALDSVGYDTSTNVGELNTNNGLTKHETAEFHRNVIRSRYPWTEEITWLQHVTTPTLHTHYVGSTSVSKIYLGSTEITKAYHGSTEIWP